ncbi:VOC family protein [Brevibacterium sp.]|uniref:VOC family protein n=1 Tax=Brevibacterium sp. TaxID=1701 RepID=UPI002810BFE0|nr:VOC family protein [Brevibacterium sp.]
MGQPVAMFEIVSDDHESLGNFYSDLFGWSVNSDPAWGPYALIDTQSGEGALGGGIGPAEGASDKGVKIYVKVDDLGAALERAEKLGGTRLVEPTPLPEGFGSFAMMADPDGNPVGLWA